MVSTKNALKNMYRKWLIECVGAILLRKATLSSDTKRNYWWFQLFHGYTNMTILTHGINAFLTDGNTIFNDVNDVDPQLVTNVLWRILQLWSIEIPWALAVGERPLLLQHHLPALLFWPYAIRHRPSVVLALALAESQTMPKLCFNIVPRLFGFGFQHMKRLEFWSRLSVVMGVRLPIMWSLMTGSTNPVVRLFGLMFGLHDLRTIAKMTQKYF
uniref:TLC domain-containing protein n=1 Tax=Chaetoceros debilis TaxID=122233 RepID=A0A6S8WN52_9STRA|mmetsp:Transcript_1250/g.1771  ORF Transcript_1250/g.1771 Transcript_1250/m.1771 type:complete len:214 (-) Transcript_1250:1130-1771(-)